MPVAPDPDHCRARPYLWTIRAPSIKSAYAQMLHDTLLKLNWNSRPLKRHLCLLPANTARKYGRLKTVKTTIEIPDQLADDAKLYAAQNGLSLSEVHERALRLLLFPASKTTTGFKLKTIVTQGEGLQVAKDWGTVRDLIYPAPVE